MLAFYINLNTPAVWETLIYTINCLSFDVLMFSWARCISCARVWLLSVCISSVFTANRNRIHVCSLFLFHWTSSVSFIYLNKFLFHLQDIGKTHRQRPAVSAEASFSVVSVYCFFLLLYFSILMNPLYTVFAAASAWWYGYYLFYKWNHRYDDVCIMCLFVCYLILIGQLVDLDDFISWTI